MNRFVIVGPTFCIDCHICETAYSETYRQHGLQSMPRLRVMLNEKESAPQLCHHYEDAPYAVVCPVNAITRADGAAQLNESLCISCKLCGTACPFDAVEFSGGRPLDIPVNASIPETSPASPVPAHVGTLLGWMPGICAIAAKCDLCSFGRQGPAHVRVCLTRALHLMGNTDTTRVDKRKRKLIFNTDFGDFTLFQQVQSGETK